jgi:hypothetical protein
MASAGGSLLGLAGYGAARTPECGIHPAASAGLRSCERAQRRHMARVGARAQPRWRRNGGVRRALFREPSTVARGSSLALAFNLLAVSPPLAFVAGMFMSGVPGRGRLSRRVCCARLVATGSLSNTRTGGVHLCGIIQAFGRRSYAPSVGGPQHMTDADTSPADRIESVVAREVPERDVQRKPSRLISPDGWVERWHNGFGWFNRASDALAVACRTTRLPTGCLPIAFTHRFCEGAAMAFLWPADATPEPSRFVSVDRVRRRQQDLDDVLGSSAHLSPATTWRGSRSAALPVRLARGGDCGARAVFG